MFDTPPSMGITKSTAVLYHILFRIAIGEKHFSVQKTGIFASFPGEIAGPGHLSKGRDEFLDPVERLRDVLHRVGVGDPGEAFAAVAERRAGDDRDAAFVEELLAEFLGGQPEAGDVRVDVERAFRLEAVDPHAAQTADEITPAPVILRAHHRDVLVPVPERFDRRELGGRRRAHDRVLVDLEHVPRDLPRRERVAHAPSGHRVGF